SVVAVSLKKKRRRKNGATLAGAIRGTKAPPPSPGGADGGGGLAPRRRQSGSEPEPGNAEADDRGVAQHRPGGPVGQRLDGTLVLAHRRGGGGHALAEQVAQAHGLALVFGEPGDRAVERDDQQHLLGVLGGPVARVLVLEAALRGAADDLGHR